MGGGSFSSAAYSTRTTSMGYHKKSAREIFTNFEMTNKMNPKDVMLRESRDSQEHPNSVAMMIALDVTGSMEQVPHNIVRNGLPHIMDSIIQRGINDPQLLFAGIGDHTCDEAPFQVGQFESSDELLQKWLTDIFLEGHGGANEGESYLLAWYFAGYRTAIDCHEKRQQKGFLFTIGDEPCLPDVRMHDMTRMFGGQHQDIYTAEQLLAKAQEKYNVYHIHILETRTGKKPGVVEGWERLIGQNLITSQSYESVSKSIADVMVENCMVESVEPQQPEGAADATPEEQSSETTQEML